MNNNEIIKAFEQWYNGNGLMYTAEEVELGKAYDIGSGKRMQVIAFYAGLKSRQAEIDRLENDVRSYKEALKCEYDKREALDSTISNLKADKNQLMGWIEEYVILDGSQNVFTVDYAKAILTRMGKRENDYER